MFAGTKGMKESTEVLLSAFIASGQTELTDTFNDYT
jgi:hypothetical protein